MEQQSSHEMASILHELDLGQHTLFVMSDGSIDLLANNDEQTPYIADNAISLDSDETYRLFISLHEQFKQKGSRRGGDTELASVVQTEANEREHANTTC